jgi:methyl-accepting chemotaxis protein
MSSLSAESKSVIKRLFMAHQVYTGSATAPLAYLLAIISGLDAEQGKWVLTWLLPILMPFNGVIFPYLIIRSQVSQSIGAGPEVSPEERLSRILKIPGRIEFFMIATTILGGFIFAVMSVVKYGKSPWIIPWTIVDMSMLTMLLLLLERQAYAEILRPYAIAVFQQAPDRMPKGSGFLWARQSWVLPYAFGVFVASTIVITLTILGRKAYDAYEYLQTQIPGKTIEQVSVLLSDTASLLAKELVLPVSLVGSYLLIIAAQTAWKMAQHQTQGARSIADSLEGLAQGKPRLPNWVSTDEIGDLAAATARVFDQLRAFSLSLKDSALSLQSSAERLGESTNKQTQMLSMQASALQETHVTAEEIKTTSLVASQKAGNILQQAERADEISRSGETSLQQALEGIEEIGSQVRQMATSIKSLDERARQVARITSMVKDLADQSNMLALNAAIEAVRNGESGKGFGVVAKEIRALADQSIRATNNIRSILQDISGAIATASTLTVKGTQRVESSISQVRAFSVQVQQLSGIVRDNAASVRQITAAVTQQDAGIAQITQAVQQLTSVMEQTMDQMNTSSAAIEVVRKVGEEVSGVVTSYGWSQGSTQQGGTASRDEA